MEQTPTRFRDLGISENFLGILEKLKFETPTPIQHQAIPAALGGKDVIGIAQTGTGKTLAFGIPMIQNLAVNKGQGLILLPTRELALQVDEVLQLVGKPLGLRTAVVIGGAAMGRQIQDLKKKPHIIISTPGRLNDLLEQKVCSLERVKGIVLDEADRMLDCGFLPQIKKILAQAPKDRQTMLFSATMPAAIASLAGAYMRSPLRIEVAPAGTSAKNVEQEVFVLEKNEKMQLLDKLLAESTGTVLIFSRTKFGAKKIARDIRAMGHNATELHSNRSLAQRRAALDGFKSGQYRVLVATDIAARGIDVDNISLVINFDLPDTHEDYVHRIGRTGRAGNSGKAISFATPDQRSDLKAIERLIRKTLPILNLPKDLPPKRPKAAPEQREQHHGRERGQRPSGRGQRAGGNRRGGFRSRSR